MSRISYIFSYSLFFVVNLSLAQIPNGGFENWEKVVNRNAEDPQHWTSSNRIVDTPKVRKSTDAHSGNYALRIDAETEPFQRPFISLGSLSFDTTNGGVPYVPEFQCTGNATGQVPQVLMGYYKFVAPTVNEGSAYISVSLNPSCPRTMPGPEPIEGSFDDFRAVNQSGFDYRPFAIPLKMNYLDSSFRALDTLVIQISMHMDTNLGQNSSGYLLLDDLQLLGSLNNPSVKLEQQVKIFPNPATDVLNISAPEGIHAHTLEVFSMTGKKVMETPYRQKLDLRNLKSALYLLKIHTRRSVVVKRFMIGRN